MSMMSILALLMAPLVKRDELAEKVAELESRRFALERELAVRDNYIAELERRVANQKALAEYWSTAWLDIAAPNQFSPARTRAEAQQIYDRYQRVEQQHYQQRMVNAQLFQQNQCHQNAIAMPSQYLQNAMQGQNYQNQDMQGLAQWAHCTCAPGRAEALQRELARSDLRPGTPVYVPGTPD